MDREEFETIMSEERPINFDPGCDAVKGLLIIQKYLPLRGVEAAGHDIIYSAGVDEILEAGITKEDARRLSDFNWMIDEDSLATFV